MVMENKNTDQSLAPLIQEFSGFKGLGVGVSKIMCIVPERTVIDHQWRSYIIVRMKNKNVTEIIQKLFGTDKLVGGIVYIIILFKHTKRQIPPATLKLSHIST
jgi:hypothetical protein